MGACCNTLQEYRVFQIVIPGILEAFPGTIIRDIFASVICFCKSLEKLLVLLAEVWSQEQALIYILSVYFHLD